MTDETIEDAYVNFILYCNPAVPLESDTTVLREAFQNPPKSGGKSFKTYTLFELIRQLEAKELKTWIELALKLGVEPPDQHKGQSSQRIQQYAVRLKVSPTTSIVLFFFSLTAAEMDAIHACGCVLRLSHEPAEPLLDERAV